jgi:RNA polymerase sigma-70 factor (ECF subfamily)
MPNRDDAFVELVRANEARLRKICRVYADGAETARDLYQDILVALWRSFDTFESRNDASASTWLYRVALNTALSHDRKQTVRTDATLDPDDPVWTDGIDPPTERVERNDKLQALYAAIDRLDDVDKALVMMYLDETPYAEMADVLGISENYVGVKLHRIKNQLASWLEETPA